MDVLGVKLPAQQLVGIAPQTPSPNPDCNSLGNMLVGEAAITGAVPFIVAPLLQGHQATSATKQPSFSNDILECIIHKRSKVSFNFHHLLQCRSQVTGTAISMFYQLKLHRFN